MRNFPFEINIIRKSIKNSRIRISPDCTVHITVPHGADVERLIHSRKDWIQKKIVELNHLAQEYESGDGSFIYDGRMWHPVFSESGPVTFSWPDICYPSVKELKKSIKESLRDDLAGRLDYYSKQMGVDYGRVSVRNQKTRWGSCSGKGNMNFNIRAMALPETIRDYLVIHELAHRIEMNHSSKFWETVAKYYPGFREAERMLKACWIAVGRNRIWNAVLDM